MEAQVQTNEELRLEVAEKNRIMREGTLKQKRIMIAKDVLQLLEAHTIRVGHGGFITLDHGEAEALGRSVVARDGNGYTGRMDAKQAQEMFERCEILAGCEVCALGALTVSGMRLFDGFSPLLGNGGKMFEVGGRGQSAEASAEDGNMLGFLQGFFEEKQMAMIEAAYEKGGGYYSGDHPIVHQDAEFEDGETFESEMDVECRSSECSESEHTVTVYHSGEEKRVMPEWWRKAVVFGRRDGNSATRLRKIMENIVANEGEFIPDVTGYELDQFGDDQD